MKINSEFNISEIFYSIQGEGTRSGMPCVFVRLQGCRLRCKWCDTPYALEIKQIETIMTEQEIYNEIIKYDCNFIEFTGGEPLEQANIMRLMAKLCDEGFEVAVETSGYIDLSDLDARIIKILDIKCPDSLMHKKNNFDNINYLTSIDEVKFVIASISDYEYAKSITEKYGLVDKCNSVIFSPVFNSISNLQLAELILKDKLKVRFQLQIHKFIWDPNTRGV